MQQHWKETYKLCQDTLTLRLPPELEGCFIREIPKDITQIHPMDAFFDFENDENTFILVKMMEDVEIKDIVWELRKLYEVLKLREEGFERLDVRKRTYKGIPQAMLCYRTTGVGIVRYYMLVTTVVKSRQYLYLFTCLGQERDQWEDIFYKVLDSAVIS